MRVETRLPHPEGDFRRVMIIDDARGWVLEQHLYDPAGQLLASATMSGHRRDPLANVILPKSVKIVWPATKFEMTIELNTVAVNQMTGDPQQMWSMPNFGAATPPVNLADPNLRLTPAQPVPPPPAAYPERTDVQTTRTDRLAERRAALGRDWVFLLAHSASKGSFANRPRRSLAGDFGLV